VPQFSKERWPENGPVRSLLTYLDRLHRNAGQPSLTEIGKAVALAPSTLSAFFTGTRLISRGNLELVVEHLGGDVDRAERLRRRAATAWNAERRRPPASDSAEQGVDPAAEDEADVPDDDVPDDDVAARLDIVLFDAPVNKLNRPAHLLGRQDLIDATARSLDSDGRVLLYGLAGTGKTALAATIADTRIEGGKGSYLWLRAGTSDAGLIVDGLLRRLASAKDRARIATVTGDERSLAIAAAIAASGITLCVFDDVWDAPALYATLRAIPDQVGVLVTSRRKLVLPIALEVAGLDPDEAVGLLELHTGCPGGIKPEERPDAAALCADLGHHPYAIEIAGHHLRQYDLRPAELRAYIADAPHDLPMPGHFAQAGRESVKRLLDRTCEMLDDPAARAALAAFGAFFSGTATVDLLAAHLGYSERQTQDALRRLVDASLARRVAGTRRYQVHDLTYSYARAQSSAAGSGPGAAVDTIVGFLNRHRGDGDVLDLELDNILGAAHVARRAGSPAFVDIMETLATGGYLDERGHTLDLLRLLDDAIATVRADTGDHALRLHQLLSKRGNASYNQGHAADAADHYRGALELSPSPQRTVILLSVLGKVLAELGSHAEADAHFTNAYAIADAGHDREGMLRVLEQRSVAAFLRKDYALLKTLTLEGVALSRELGARTLEAVFLNNLGTADFELGVCAAMERHEQARRIADDIGNEHIQALAHRALGADYQAQERFTEANEHLRRALDLYRKLGQTERETSLRRMMQQFGHLP
jgi:tetratricopeptide (TPR) repeat protein